MSEVLRVILDRGRVQHDALTERIHKQASLLAGWMILGNAGALVLTLKAITDNPDCASNDTIKNSAVAFAFGLLLTFSGVLIGNLLGSILNFRLGQIIDEVQGSWIAEFHIEGLERQGIIVPEDAPLRADEPAREARMNDLSKRLKRLAMIAIGASSVLAGAGSVSFAYGLLAPLLSEAPLCAAEAVASKPSVSLARPAEPSPESTKAPATL